ncbi:MAG: DoxX family protein [Candidatus Acidiferrales bacterium]
MRFMENLKPLSLLLLRLALGGIFMYHGYPELFTNHNATVAGFEHMGFPSYFATLSGALEFFGGILLVVGLVTRLAALLLAIEMGIALARVAIPRAGIYAVGKYQLPLVLCTAAFALATVGAGAISLDRVTFEGGGSKSAKKSKPSK